MNNMKNNFKNLIMTIIVTVMSLSMAACGQTASEDAFVTDVSVEKDVSDVSEDDGEEAEEESAEDEETEAEDAEAEEPEAEEVVDENPDFKFMHFIEWGSGRGVHSSFKVNPEDEWSCNMDFWADYEAVDGQCNISRKIEGLYYEAPIDYTRLVTGDKEDTYIMVCDQDRKYVVGYFLDESQMDSCFPWEGYDKVVNGHFAVWYTSEMDMDTVQRILDSCYALRGDELNQTFNDFYSRYVPES